MSAPDHDRFWLSVGAMMHGLRDRVPVTTTGRQDGVARRIMGARQDQSGIGSTSPEDQGRNGLDGASSAQTRNQPGGPQVSSTSEMPSQITPKVKG